MITVYMLIAVFVIIILLEAYNRHWHRKMDIEMLFYSDVLDQTLEELRKVAPFAYAVHHYATHNYPPESWDKLIRNRAVAEHTIKLERGESTDSVQDLLHTVDDVADYLGIEKVVRS